MVAQLKRAPLTYPPAPALKTGAAFTIPFPWAPHNVQSDGVPRRSSAGAQVLSLSSVWHWSPFAMAEDASSAAFLFAAAQFNLLEILTV